MYMLNKWDILTNSVLYLHCRSPMPHIFLWLDAHVTSSHYCIMSHQHVQNVTMVDFYWPPWSLDTWSWLTVTEDRSSGLQDLAEEWSLRSLLVSTLQPLYRDLLFYCRGSLGCYLRWGLLQQQLTSNRGTKEADERCNRAGNRSRKVRILAKGQGGQQTSNDVNGVAKVNTAKTDARRSGMEHRSSRDNYSGHEQKPHCCSWNTCSL